MDTLFWTFTLSPMTTSGATKQFCPNEQPRPIRHPLEMWQKCQIRVPGPIWQPGSTTLLGWTKQSGSGGDNTGLLAARGPAVVLPDADRQLHGLPLGHQRPLGGAEDLQHRQGAVAVGQRRPAG